MKFFSGINDEIRQALGALNVPVFNVELEKGGLGLNQQIIEIFCRHMEAALDIIPQNMNHGTHGIH